MFFRLLSVLLVVWFIYSVREVFPPLIVGAIIAYLLLPIAQALKNSTRIHMRAAVAIIYLIFLAAVAFLVWWFGPKLAEQFTNLAASRQEIVSNLISQISDRFSWQVDIPKATKDVLRGIEQNFGNPGELVHFGALVSKGMLALLVTIVSSIYLIVDNRRVGYFFLRFIPQESRHTAIGMSQQMNSMLSKYVRGQLILITLMWFVAYAFLHFVFHIKYALLIALLSGFLEIIPVLGPILATSTATLVGISQNGFDCAVPIILCYTAARWVEDYIIIPGVIGHAVELHPLAVIFAVLCGEVLAGGLGMLIAIPVAASIKVILDSLYPPLSAVEAESGQTASVITGAQPNSAPDQASEKSGTA